MAADAPDRLRRVPSNWPPAKILMWSVSPGRIQQGLTIFWLIYLLQHLIRVIENILPGIHIISDSTFLVPSIWLIVLWLRHFCHRLRLYLACQIQFVAWSIILYMNSFIIYWLKYAVFLSTTLFSSLFAIFLWAFDIIHWGIYIRMNYSSFMRLWVYSIFFYEVMQKLF